jgi:pimeloyl-ACP methyl ester carboxylesterase
VDAERRDGVVELAGGRSLAYREGGDPAAPAVLYFHGVPGSRLDADVFRYDGGTPPVRLIAVDRPGFGRSTPRPGRRPVDWPADVVALADALELERFAVLGFSSGAKFALACAQALPARVSVAGLVAGVGPPDMPRFFARMGVLSRLDYAAAVRLRPLARGYREAALRFARRRPRAALAVFERGLSRPDRRLMRDPAVRAWALRTALESGRQGVDATLDEAVMERLPWGFPLEEVTIPVRLWHGERDATVPPHHSQHVAGMLRSARLTVLPGEGHLLVRRFAGFASSLASA